MIKEYVDARINKFSKFILKSYELDEDEFKEFVKNFVSENVDTSEIKERATKAKEKKMFYNVETKRYMKSSKQNENKGIVFYSNLGICGTKQSTKLTNAVAMLLGKKIKHQKSRKAFFLFQLIK